MNNYDDNQSALTSIPQTNRELAKDVRKIGGYPAYSRYPAVDVEKNSVREYFRIIRRHKWVVLATLVVLVTIVTIGTVLTRPVFRAEAKLEVGRETERVAQGRQILEMESASVFNPYFMQTQIDNLNSRDLARRVIQKLNLADNEEFKFKNADKLSENEREVRLVNAFQARYGVSVGRQTKVVSLTFDSYDPKLAAEVTNAAAAEFITWSMESRLQGVSSAKDFLADRVKEAETALREAEAEQQQYLAAHRIISSAEDKANITIDRTAELNRQLVELQNERRLAEAVYNRSKEVPADELPQVITDATVQALTRELSKQRQELANLLAKYQPTYPAVKQVQEQVKQLETQLTEQKAKIVKNIETQYQVAKRREEDLASSLNQSKNEAIQQNRESSELSLIKQKIATNLKNYEDLLGRLRQAEVEMDFRPSNIRQVQQAEIPIVPVKPNKVLNIGLSLLIGLSLGIGLAFFLEYLNNTINTAEDVERIVQLPALGGIPSLQSLAKNKMLGINAAGNGNGKKSTALTAVSNELLSGHDPLSSFAESYRALRTSLLLSSAEHAPRTMLITSSHPAEGKTTIVANTAISLAQTGARVLVLDADMRRPRCHKILSTKNDVGLSTYLSRDVSVEKVIIPHDIPNLFVMPAGPVPPNPSELLSSIKLRYLVAELQDRFDHIIIDSPPVIHVTDALIISPHVDGVVIVVKSNHTPREAVQRAKQALADVNAKIFGVVLNCIDLNTESYYYNYKYAYYHSYEESNS
ncbi:MAG: polysaccharide biosynthesis tyrosine autokinase [Acidobacteria bacterium]|nr:polysaccharide biosynthesis tyrosine autokinase [Acidobacteriota bacterium]